MSDTQSAYLACGAPVSAGAPAFLKKREIAAKAIWGEISAAVPWSEVQGEARGGVMIMADAVVRALFPPSTIHVQAGQTWVQPNGKSRRTVISVGDPTPKLIVYFLGSDRWSRRTCYISDWDGWVSRTGAEVVG